MPDSSSSSTLSLRYPPIHLGVKEKASEFEKIWPKIKAFYDGDEPELFHKFSAIVYSSYTEAFFMERNEEQHYHQLRYFFDFFMRDLESGSTKDKEVPGFLVSVEQPPSSIMPKNGHRIASTGLIIHSKEYPFILENLWGYLNITENHVIAGLYPVMTVTREKGKITDIKPLSKDGSKEIFTYISIAKIVSARTIKKLEREVTATLESLFLSVIDFPKITKRVADVCDRLCGHAADSKDGEEAIDFFKWLLPDNFIFMGMTSFDLHGSKAKEDEKKRLGVYKNQTLMETVFPCLAKDIKKLAVQYSTKPYSMIFNFLPASPNIIYHKDSIDVIAIREFDKNKKPVKASIILGRFSRGATMNRSAEIPFLRKKLNRIFEMDNIRPKSHLHREILTVFNTLPKKELFYADTKSLSATLNISVMLKSEDEVHLLVRKCHEFEYMTVILIFSIKNHSHENTLRLADFFEKLLGKKLLYIQTSRTTVVGQIFIYFPLAQNEEVKIDTEKTVGEIKELITTWDKLLMKKLVARLTDTRGFAIYNLLAPRLTKLYKEAVTPKEAVNDLLLLKKAVDTGELQIDIQCKSSTSATLRIFLQKELSLMKLIPTFSNLGINVKEELALPLKKDGTDTLHIQLLTIEETEDKIDLLVKHKQHLIETIQLVISQTAEDCPLNSLVLSAGFTWKQVDLLRAYQNYIIQINMTANPSSVTATFNKFPDTMSLLVSYFEERFNPKSSNVASLKKKREKFFKKLEDVTDLGEDNILRLLFNIMENTLRTNYYTAKEDHYISFKVNCAGVIQMPKPVPMAEIYVHSPSIEGVHLRGGKVARGGLRWSDRPDDFRTEILGLMKTQMVKNSVIVPVGSKGGFVIKKMKAKTTQERMSLFKKNYQTFIKGLLDLTDNLLDGEPIPPKDVVCFDDPDPYLVVAADKGTATMSDAANEVSEQYRFWLKDAFASGGSIGYDHKKFGITAKGAWECVKRHFRELGTDIQTEPVTVSGVGGMAGDVFGNGMLLSTKIKLVAAFDHLNIFLDPSPDPAKSHKERKRLFEMPPGNTWEDYDPKLISKGGGVFKRSAKQINLSSEAKKMLLTDKDSMSGLELIKTILSMPVDLLYFGGIGTYVRSSRESNADVGDKANDPVRVTADELRAKVLGEGANLAITQNARIELAENGGRLNTDSVDNSAGVDISDHEVNLKILLEILLAKGELESRDKAIELFVKLGPEIAEMVLMDNYLQSAGITLDQERSEKKPDIFLNYINDMETAELFDRIDENIPDTETLASYSEKPAHMLRPILSVIYGYEKMRLNDAILSSSIVDTTFARRYLYSYFPPVVIHDHEQSLSSHRLKKEIISTIISNQIVNQAGVTFAHGMEIATGASPWEICRAYLIASNLLQADDYRKMVHALDNKVDAKVQVQFLLKMEDLLSKIVAWMLTHIPVDRVSFDFVNQYQEVVDRFKQNLFKELETICSLDKGCLDKKVKEFAKQNIPEELAKWIVILPYMKDIMSMLSIKEERHADFMETGNLYILVTNNLDIDWVFEMLESCPIQTRWEKQMVENLSSELENCQRHLVMKVLDFRRKDESMEKAFRNYIGEKEKSVSAYKDTVAKIKEEKGFNIMAIGVLIKQLEDFT